MKRALVLCGGGSLGSYEVGAWRFLREKGLDDFDIVTGTSIGAINGALVVSGEFEKAEALWKTVEADKIISNGINFYDGMWYNFTKADFNNLVALAKDYVKNGGVDISPPHRAARQGDRPAQGFGLEDRLRDHHRHVPGLPAAQRRH
ncbi:MAG: patatin-like phospholipase family protein [Bacilli bacterium]|nr:patatin-like phospholipase family protein [Bacilli bacterium]